jgi:hypothetical protein
MEEGDKKEKNRKDYSKRGEEGIAEWAGGLLISFVPKLLQDLTTKYGRDITPMDKSLCKVQVEEKTAT